MKSLIQRFKINNLDELSDKISPFNHLLDYVRFFDIYENDFIDKNNIRHYYYNCQLVFNEKALPYLN